MNRQLRNVLIAFGTIVIASGSIAYGAMTAPRPAAERPTLKAPVVTQKQLDDRLPDEQLIIASILMNAYPKISTEYTLSGGKLYDQGQWYGAILTYRGSDTANRDTLRILMQKKDNVWTIRTNPPMPLLSAKQFPDVPKSILQAINQPVSLP